MLLQISIRNFALIDEIRVDFDRGLNVLTGETGAGKSILIDALKIVLGERMESSSIRDKSQGCVLEAVFSLSPEALKNQEHLRDFIKGDDECLIFRREISPEGKSKNYMNGQFVNLSQLKGAGKWLVNIHGQHDHQEIFDPSSHLSMIDGLAKHHEEGSPLDSYRRTYQRYADLVSAKEKIKAACEGKEREMDLLNFQIQEIEKVNPQRQEEHDLKEMRIRLAHAEKLHDLTAKILTKLDEEDHSVSKHFVALYRDIAEWCRIDPSASGFKDETDQIQVTIEELIRSIRGYQEKLEFDGNRLREIDARLEALEWIGRKYGRDFETLQKFLTEAKKRLDELVNSEVHQKELDEEIAALLPELDKKAKPLSKRRQAAADKLTQAVLGDLRDLGIRHANFKCQITPCGFSPDGAEQIEFLLSPNAGEPLKPLAMIASGGEASRIMLAIKHALARADFIPTLIFDEIDANVGGRLGREVGQKLREIADERQVLLITHLPQIASFADRHIKVSKKADARRTSIDYEILSKDDQIRELAQMMSGEKETEISKVHAKEMLKTAAR